MTAKMQRNSGKTHEIRNKLKFLQKCLAFFAICHYNVRNKQSAVGSLLKPCDSRWMALWRRPNSGAEGASRETGKLSGKRTEPTKLRNVGVRAWVWPWAVPVFCFRKREERLVEYARHHHKRQQLHQQLCMGPNYADPPGGQWCVSFHSHRFPAGPLVRLYYEEHCGLSL